VTEEERRTLDEFIEKAIDGAAYVPPEALEAYWRMRLNQAVGKGLNLVELCGKCRTRL
jgi:hypothetical protein